MPKLISRRKFTDTINKLGNYEVKLSKKTTPQGFKCYSGFILSLDTGKCAYLDTESVFNPHCGYKVLVRSAREMYDYTGGMNNFVSSENSPYFVHNLLRQ
jgi:hypothetical protein